MNEIDDIKARSISSIELVVNYTDAMELLFIYKQNGIKVLGWEGWIRYLDGKSGHSQRYQGSVNLSQMSVDASIAKSRSSIMQSHEEWRLKPEVEGADLYFCITTEA